jgi:uroporphyrin-III C-methyltransferase/precorrin-2 dehydrogenase/sirohydrochlorin ferrochelatase
VVIADRLAPRALLAELGPDVELIDATKLPRGRAADQGGINEVMVQRALAGKSVVRFKGGDPFVFGRGFEEAIACAEAGVPFRVVPGITSAVSVPALGGIPVTHRGVAHEFTVVSGHIPPGHPDSLVDWEALARLRGTLVLLMAVENLPAITSALLAAGRDPRTPAAVVQDGSMASQRLVHGELADIAAASADAGIRPPAIVVIGDVVGVAREVAAAQPAG